MTARSESFLSASSVLKEDMGGGIVRQILGYDPSIMMVRVEFDKGAVGDVHSHIHSQIAYVESGEFEVFIDGETRRLGPGDSFYAPPNRDHGVVCLKPGVLIDVFSPMREDFLDDKKTY
jgi:quercetin dioxygenase-like cupin family protein